MFRTSFLVLGLGLFLAVPVAGCSAASDDASSSESAITASLHEPQGAERKAIHEAFRAALKSDLHDQRVLFNTTNPAGRFLAHGDYAYLEGFLEGPDGNRTPIDYANTVFAQDFANGYLEGTTISGNFAAKFQGLVKKNGDGTWSVASVTYYPGNEAHPTYAVGPAWESWKSWTSLPTPAERDIFVSAPSDDLHEPVGAERAAVIAELKGVITPKLNGQVPAFNATDPKGTFLSHDGWVFFAGIIEGPNGNTTPIDYRNSAYAQQATTTAFQGVLRNNHFAATFRALLQRQPDGSFKVAATTEQAGYVVGSNAWVGDTTSEWAWDIYGESGNGQGNGNGEGDGDGDGEGEGG